MPGGTLLLLTTNAPHDEREQFSRDVANLVRKHVMRDLKPYVCTSEECDTKLFPGRHVWFTHELQSHWVEWHCCFCSGTPYPTREKFDKHLRKNHADTFIEDQLSDLIKVCQKPVDKLLPSACPFCDEWEDRLREINKHMSPDETLVVTPQQFRHHVGSHMEQLALFAIPRGYKEDGDAGSSRAAPGHGSDTSSERSLVRVDYEEGDNPRLHVLAFEGLLDEVKSLRDETIHTPIFQNKLLEEGSTWGSGMNTSLQRHPIDLWVGDANILAHSLVRSCRGWPFGYSRHLFPTTPPNK
jgi:hypothetical protein